MIWFTNLKQENEYKNVYYFDFLTKLPQGYFKKWNNFLDGIEFNLNEGIKNYENNRLVFISSSFLEKSIFNEQYNDIFSEHAIYLSKNTFYQEYYGKELIKKVSKKEVPFLEIIKKGSATKDFFESTIIKNIKNKTFLKLTETIIQPEQPIEVSERYIYYIYYLYDITGLNLQDINNLVEKESKVNGLLNQYKESDEILGYLYITEALQYKLNY